MTFDKTQEPYISLRNVIAERTQSIVIWAGSGVSASVGLPIWKNLKAQLLTKLKAKAETFDEDSKNKILTIVGIADKEANNWVAFEIIKNALGDTSWKESIREILGAGAQIKIPEVYSKIWKLRVSGILTLNLDRLATAAFVESNPHEDVIDFVGNRAGEFVHVLKSPRSFICNLHGDVQQASSWVLTAKELRELSKNAGYETFIKSCLAAKTILFVGISADDVAVGSFLENLTKIGISFGAHYWVTNRRDLDTDKWAEKVGVRVIRYEVKDNVHTALLEMFDDIASFISKENPASVLPIVPEEIEGDEQELISPNNLSKMDAEKIRLVLNKEAKAILAKGNQQAYEKYDEFTKKYDEAIYRAWYTGVLPGNNKLLGHVLNKEIAYGAFGKVYQATESTGEQVAIKILHEGIRKDPDLLHNFRRGVRSMRILKSHDVQGMVSYRDAFEIPACVVMDWINGPDLGKAVEMGLINDWNTILKVSSEIARVVREGHQLPERVLHRDLRPSNVMLKDFYKNPGVLEIVVLDFDLSWHRGAFERDVIHGSRGLGYLAPEQLQEIKGVSTRHASVDSFGLGMVLYFLVSGLNPIPDQHLHVNWEKDIIIAAEKRPCKVWCSMPERITRLILKSTKQRQAERWDMAQIQGELERLAIAENDPTSVMSAELLAEEIAFRSEFMKDYEWDDNTLSAVKDSASGIRFYYTGG